MKRQIHIIVLAAALFAGILYGHAQKMEEVREFPGGARGYLFDSTRVWHPETIHIVWMENMQLEFRLPYEPDRSGVANILFRERDSGKIRMLDTIIVNPDYDPLYEWDEEDPLASFENLKYRRAAITFEPGNYDAVLLYNNGKYIVFENITFDKGIKTTIDMGLQPVREADRDSRKWLKMRKFTAPVEERMVITSRMTVSPYRISGYVLSHSGVLNGGYTFRLPYGSEKEFWKRFRNAGKPSEDGYFELSVAEEDTLYTLSLDYPYSPSVDMDVKANTWLFFVPEKFKRPTTAYSDGIDVPLMQRFVGASYSNDPRRKYYREFPADTTISWHPEQLHIVWPDMKIDFRFPHEKERSGVANLLFREKKLGRIRTLDYVEDGILWLGKKWDHRIYNEFEPGSYDAILLYNSGKYIVYENITFQEGMKVVIDMAGQPVRKADAESGEWLGLRKFTDVVGVRDIESYRDMDKYPEKIMGYVFSSKSKRGVGTTLTIPTDADSETEGASDGYFEFGYKPEETGSMLKISRSEDVEIEIRPNHSYFIVLDSPPVEIPKIIGSNPRKE